MFLCYLPPFTRTIHVSQMTPSSPWEKGEEIGVPSLVGRRQRQHKFGLFFFFLRPFQNSTEMSWPFQFHVIFSYHYALLFRVPTWGLVFFFNGQSGGSFIVKPCAIAGGGTF